MFLYHNIKITFPPSKNIPHYSFKAYYTTPVQNFHNDTFLNILQFIILYNYYIVHLIHWYLHLFTFHTT